MYPLLQVNTVKHIHVHIYMYVHVFMCMCVCVCVHVCVYLFIYVCMYVCMYVQFMLYIVTMHSAVKSSCFIRKDCVVCY